jgi:hypothetical protein
MMKKPIRNLRSSKPIPPRVFDVVIDGDELALEIKTGKNQYETVSWSDVVSQVEQARNSL